MKLRCMVRTHVTDDKIAEVGEIVEVGKKKGKELIECHGGGRFEWVDDSLPAPDPDPTTDDATGEGDGGEGGDEK